MKERAASVPNRNSSIELLKIFGLTVIVLGHVVQTIGTVYSEYVPFSDYFVNLRAATNQPQYLILAMLRYCGGFGNTLFFVCSAWFFLDNNRVEKKRIFMLLMDIWMVSVLILVIVLVLGHRKLINSLILMSIFPTTFENNWYLSCYLIFYAIHPLLNKIIISLSQKSLLRLNVAAFFLYFIIGFATCFTRYMFGEGTTFFSSRLILWTVIYFVIGYLKKYERKLLRSNKVNYFLVIFGFLGYFGLVCLMNLIGLNSSRFYDSLQIWRVDQNPFMVILALGLFNFANSREFKSKWINYVAKLTPFIYIIHENRILRGIYRPELWQWVFTSFGYAHVLAWAFLMAAAVFSFGLIFSILYAETIHKLMETMFSKIYLLLSERWRHIENGILKR